MDDFLYSSNTDLTTSTAHPEGEVKMSECDDADDSNERRVVFLFFTM